MPKKMEIIIRYMELDDLAKVFHLGEKLFTSREMPNLYRTWDQYEVARLFLDSSDYCLVAEKDNELVGFILGETITKYHNAWKYGYLIWIGVETSHRRLGIASKLTDHFISLMLKEDVRMILVDTEADNQSGISFFEKKGFIKPQKHIYMTLNLDKK